MQTVRGVERAWHTVGSQEVEAATRFGAGERCVEGAVHTVVGGIKETTRGGVQPGNPCSPPPSEPLLGLPVAKPSPKLGVQGPEQAGE